MDVVAVLIVLAAFAGSLYVLGRPLLPGQEDAVVRRDELRRADLEAAKVAKYREIRDAELDHRTGKLSDADWRTVDRGLRADAVAILHGLDELGPVGSDEPTDAPPPAGSDEPADAPPPAGSDAPADAPPPAAR